MESPLKLKPLGSLKTRRKSGVQGSWRLLAGLALTFGTLMALTSWAFETTPLPLPVDAPLGLFAEGRALHTTAQLADTIGHRQVSTVGEKEAAAFLLSEAKSIATDARKHRQDLDVLVAKERVSGALGKQVVFGLEIANAYNGLSNIILRIAPKELPNDSIKSVLVNAHYDSTLGSPGASDAGSCVAVALEMARTIVANASLPLEAPIIFLFNGGEETLMQASHGFMASSPFAKELGAFINLESTGPWGPDVLFQHSGDWTLRAYARAAPYPRGTVVGQDFFELGVIPADTDYRMFSYRHYGTVPGIDVAFIFDGTAYHTSRDETKRIRPGTLQAMGENMLATALEYARVLRHGDFKGEEVEVESAIAASPRGHVFFDILSQAMVVYSHNAAAIIHQAPLLLLLSLSLKSAVAKVNGDRSGSVPPPGPLLRQTAVALLAVLGAVLAPALAGAVRVLLTHRPISWYGNHQAGYLVYIPASAAGLMAPLMHFGSRCKGYKNPVARARAGSLGFALLFAGISTALTAIGMHSAYLYVAWSLGATAAALLMGPTDYGFTWRSVLAICVSFIGPITVVLPTGMTVATHIMEKIGLSGSAEGPLGAAVPDAAVGALTGVGMVLIMGISMPYIVAALGKKSKALLTLFLITALAAAAVPFVLQKQKASQAEHPYSYEHPKRVIFQHFHRHTPSGHVYDSFFTFSSLDAIPVDAALPAAALSLPEAPYRNEDWVALYPINYLVTGIARKAPGPSPGSKTPSLKVISDAEMARYIGTGGSSEDAGVGVARLWNKFKNWLSSTFLIDEMAVKDGQRPLGLPDKENNVNEGSSVDEGEEEGSADAVQLKRWNFEMDTITSAWSVLNITGNIRNWSLGSEIASTKISDTKRCHMVRYASGYGTSKWRFWVETPAEDDYVRIELFVKHLQPSKPAKEILDAMPEWVSPAAVTTWASVWEFESIGGNGGMQVGGEE